MYGQFLWSCPYFLVIISMLSTKAKSASVVILTAGRIPRKDLTRDICERKRFFATLRMTLLSGDKPPSVATDAFIPRRHFVQHDKRGFVQHLYYPLIRKGAPWWVRPVGEERSCVCSLSYVLVYYFSESRFFSLKQLLPSGV